LILERRNLSCGCTLIVFEEAPKPFATLHRACTLAALADRRKEQDIALALMIDLPVVNRKKTTNFNKFY